MENELTRLPDEFLHCLDKYKAECEDDEEKTQSKFLDKTRSALGTSKNLFDDFKREAELNLNKEFTAFKTDILN